MKRRLVWTVPVFIGCVIGFLYWLWIANSWGSSEWVEHNTYLDTVVGTQSPQRESEKAEVQLDHNGGDEHLSVPGAAQAEDSIVSRLDGSTPLKEAIQTIEPVDYTDPFDVTRNLFYGNQPNILRCTCLTI